MQEMVAGLFGLVCAAWGGTGSVASDGPPGEPRTQESARTAQCGVAARFVPMQLPPASPGSRQTIAVVLRLISSRTCTTATHRRAVTVTMRAPLGVSVSPPRRTASLEPSADTPVFFKLKFTSEPSPEAELAAVVDEKVVAALTLGQGYDLEALKWKIKHDPGGVGFPQGWMRSDFDDSAWGDRYLPSLWNDIGLTYLRARVFIPDSWRGKDICLRLRAVDDNDVCYLNGVVIGSTNGWDERRHYRVASEAIRFGQDNLLCIAVNNIAHGGGIYRSPNYLGVAVPAPSPAAPVQLGSPRPLGEPSPLRSMRVEDGVLLYGDGKEVALWGVNYYPQSWHQFENMKRLGVDMKKAIRDDLDDMKRMGVEVIRIHVFDREISDRCGSLIDNEHLDLLDYLISEGTKRGIYFFFTPVAWWGGPNENPDSFSARTPKEYMFCDDSAVKAQANYLRNWLSHVNRYTKRRYRDEPAVCAFEIMNEPVYVDYNAMVDPHASYYETSTDFMGPFKERLLRRWRVWCASNGVRDEKRFFSLFRYSLVRDYLGTMHAAIRGTGAMQPVACALFQAEGQEDLVSAIADSPCEAVTTGVYAGDFNTVGDGVNYLPWASNSALDVKLNAKARLVYEFDGIKTFGSYLYPAFARRFRNMGAQICCMFQYDSHVTAAWNLDWDAHYLNWYYTPGKAVSFSIGGRVFHELPRGSTYPKAGTNQCFGRCAVSFDRDVSIYSGKTIYMNSAPSQDWQPLPIPTRPSFLTGVGDSPYVCYKGSGVYTLKIDYDECMAELTINPDARVVGDPWHPRRGKKAVVLSDEPHEFTLAIPGITLRSVAAHKKRDGQITDVEVKGNTFEVTPGVYGLEW